MRFEVASEAVQRQRLTEAIQVLKDIGMPQEQLNARTAFTLLAFLNVSPETPWKDARKNVLGVYPSMVWSGQAYPAIPKGRNGSKTYAVGSRESVRKHSIHQLVAAGVLSANTDDLDRATNSSDYSYRPTSIFVEAVRAYGTDDWPAAVQMFHSQYESLKQRWAAERKTHHIPLEVDGAQLMLSPGEHSTLIAAVVAEFAPLFVPGAEILYLGDTGDKWVVERPERLAALGVTVEPHGKMPDLALYDGRREWLVLVEAVTSVGPMDPKRIDELKELFAGILVGVVYVSAFPTKALFRKFAPSIAWETEVWIHEAPTHMIHFNGARFLGPYVQN